MQWIACRLFFGGAPPCDGQDSHQEADSLVQVRLPEGLSEFGVREKNSAYVQDTGEHARRAHRHTREPHEPATTIPNRPTEPCTKIRGFYTKIPHLPACRTWMARDSGSLGPDQTVSIIEG